MNGDVEVVGVARVATTYCSPDWRWDHQGKLGMSGGCILWLVLGGRGELLEGGRAHEVGMGDCLLMPTREDKRGRHDVNHPLVVSWAEMTLVNRADRSPFTGPLHVRLERVSFLSDLFSRSLNAIRQEGNGSEAGMRWMQCLLDELFQLASRPSLRSVSHHAEAIQVLCEEIRLNPGRHRSIEQMAGKLHVSNDHFIRIFKQIRGITPGEFVLSARIEMAASLLLFTRRTVSQIADELGYCDAFHFSKQFRMRVGVPPLAYRRGGLKSAG